MIGRLRDYFRGLFTSLRAKVIFTIIVVLLVMMGVTGYLWFYFWRNQLIELTEDQISLLFQSVELSIEMAMREGRQNEVGEILRQIAEREEILSLRIYDTEGVIKRSSDPEEEGTHPGELGRHEALESAGLRLTSLRGGEEGNLRLMYPIRKKEACVTCHRTEKEYIGILEMNLSLDNIRAIVNQNRNRMIWYTLLTVLVLSLTVTILFEKEVHSPIASIVRTINEIRAGNLAARFTLATEDEFGLIARNLNSMVSRLESAIGEIRKYHQDELRKSQRLAAVGELAASISHEIRNPLAGIKGAIQVILKDENISERHREVLTEVLAQVDRLNGTVTDLLDFSRPLRPQMVPVSLGSVLDRTLDPIQLKPHLGNVVIVRNYGDLAPIPVDPNLIGQAFFNIVVNSLQALEGSGMLEVSAEEVEETVWVTFQDTGCGISPENMEKIFRPFFTTKHRGTGLGLSVARNIIEAHGGTIEVSSQVGQGAKFVVVLPKSRPD